jgi:DNA phosphorothioation-dependent restriction protein DptG
MNDVIEIANQASKEWLKEFPTTEETAHQVPKRFLEIFAKLVVAKEREACANVCDKFNWGQAPKMIQDAIRARGEA